MQIEKVVIGLIIWTIAKGLGTHYLKTGNHLPFDFLALPLWALGFGLTVYGIVNKKEAGFSWNAFLIAVFVIFAYLGFLMFLTVILQ